MLGKDHPASRFTRRRWLRMAAGSMLAGLAGESSGAESSGKWHDGNIAEYSQMLLVWLKTNFANRAETLHAETGIPFPLRYDYMGVTDDRRRLRTFEKFAEGNLTGRAAEKHIEACLTEFEHVRKSLAVAESKASTAWTAKQTEAIARDGAIFDTRVSAERLTVVLDNSPSMKPYLPKLRKEIARDFANAYFVEVNGCSLLRPAAHPWFFSAPTPVANPFAPERHIPKVPTVAEQPHSLFIRWTRDTAGALACMTDLMKTDAIYWFCDFDDSADDSVIRPLARSILENNVALFVHSLDRRVPTLLSLLAEKSGGGVVRKRI